MRVVMADVDEEQLETQAARLRAEGGEVHPVVVDVSDPDAVDRAGRAAIDRFAALHVAVNNAGINMAPRSGSAS